jgi:hypothetical protein
MRCAFLGSATPTNYYVGHFMFKVLSLLVYLPSRIPVQIYQICCCWMMYIYSKLLFTRWKRVLGRCVCLCTKSELSSTYIYIYIYKERESERGNGWHRQKERKKKRERKRQATILLFCLFTISKIIFVIEANSAVKFAFASFFSRWWPHTVK